MNATDIFIWGIFLGLFSMYICQKCYKMKKRKKIASKARRAEIKAIDLLIQHGYKILEVQLSKKVTVYIDEIPHESLIRADLLVSKGRKKYIVEVKTGNQTIPTLPNVRRQLLEYYLVFQPDGILFLDMEKVKLKTYRFDHAITNKINRYRWIIITIVILNIFLWFIMKQAV